MIILQILRAALLGGGGLALANSLALSYGGGHKVGTYIAWYMLATLLLLAGLGFWLELHRRTTSSSPASLLAVGSDESFNITTHNQSGGTNIGKLSVERPQPEIAGDTLAHHEKTNQGYKSVAAIQLKDQFAAAGLEVAVEGTTVTQITVEPDTAASIHTQSELPVTPTGGGVKVHPPLYARYLVTVLTEKADPNLKIKAQLAAS
jgi:hypothetical protein